MTENLLSFPINEKLTLKHLRQDMEDYWFYDSVQELLTNRHSLLEDLSRNLESGALQS